MTRTSPRRTLEFHDEGPDKDGKRRFTLTWPIEPRWDGFKGEPVLVSQRGRCFHSAQFHDFLAQGFEDVTPKSRRADR